MPQRNYQRINNLKGPLASLQKYILECQGFKDNLLKFKTRSKTMQRSCYFMIIWYNHQYYKLYNNAELLYYLPIIKLFPMRIGPLIPFLLLSLSLALTQEDSTCSCLNGGYCQTSNSLPNCHCPKSFIGQKCQISAIPLHSADIQVTLSSNYTYFYFEPKEVNYYKLNFNVCMIKNTNNRYSIFYIETQRNDGSLRQNPSLFQTAKIALEEGNCTDFSTHYISAKKRQDSTYRKIVIGLRVMESDEPQKYLNTYFSQNQKHPFQNFTVKANEDKTSLSQKIKIKMTPQVYLQTSYYGTFIILFTSFVLLIIVTTFITYLKKKYYSNIFDNQIDTPLSNFQLYYLTRTIRRRYNPQQYISRTQRKNNLHNIEVFMPVTYFGSSESIFGPRSMSTQQKEVKQHQCCSICLLDFQADDEIRTTPCSHQYHRQCIDNWCETKLSCPLCRRQLDFSKQIRQIYLELLRNQIQV